MKFIVRRHDGWFLQNEHRGELIWTDERRLAWHFNTRRAADQTVDAVERLNVTATALNLRVIPTREPRKAVQS